ncbi:MAG: bifunctional N(6)-L-threonylcarbamoyladenine synthase/serine/threonine protein kinase [Candidatus Bathyarchaeota archaeon]|nr:bifunctional N(6)-L-threonylcarbamoyladenine synthase/serine/threonine protein kinase [Candidatus Bathyarchaeota archaeon]
MEGGRKICLGIEGTAHTFGVGLADSSGRILANVRSSYKPPPGMGIHPRDAAQHHSMVAGETIRRALDEAGLRIWDVDAVAFSQGPGLGPCLRITATVARAISLAIRKPLIGVNHLLAHIEIGRITTGAQNPLTLLVTGGNTQLLGYEDGRYRVLGETLDITIANCFDVFAREVGLYDPTNPWPGPVFDEVADRGSTYIPLPYTVKGMDLQFSGLLTAALKAYKSGKYRLEDVAYSLRETALSMLIEVTERALAHTGKSEILVIGGFARNRRMQEMLSKMVEAHRAKVYIVRDEYATDNGAMIAWTGILHYSVGDTTSIEESVVKPRWRIEDVEVKWIAT